MRQPFLKFFPEDEEADTGFMSVSLSARAVWHHMLRVMMEADPYGFFRGTAGEEVDVGAFGRRIGEAPQAVSRLIAELVKAKVPSVDSNGRIFSRRLVRDFAKRQQMIENGSQSQKAGARLPLLGGQFGGAKSRTLPHQGDSQGEQSGGGLGGVLGPRSVRARSRNPEAHNSDSLRSSALVFEFWPPDVEGLRRIALIFVAEFANCWDPVKAEKHLPSYTGVLAAMRSRGVTIDVAWQACADAVEANSGKPLWAAAIKTAISFLPSRPALRQIPGGRKAPQTDDPSADLDRTLREIQER